MATTVTVEVLADGSLILPSAIGEQFSDVKTFQVARRDDLFVLIPQREPGSSAAHEQPADGLQSAVMALPFARAQAHRLDPTELLTLPPRVQEIGQHVSLTRFVIMREDGASPWDCLSGMIRVGQPVNIEEMLDASGFNESAHHL